MPGLPFAVSFPRAAARLLILQQDMPAGSTVASQPFALAFLYGFCYRRGYLPACYTMIAGYLPVWQLRQLLTPLPARGALNESRLCVDDKPGVPGTGPVFAGCLGGPRATNNAFGAADTAMDAAVFPPERTVRWPYRLIQDWFRQHAPTTTAFGRR